MLLEKFKEDLNSALKTGDTLRVSVLRLILSALNYELIEKQHELNDEEIIAVLKKDAKKHRESITSFKAGGREDLWKKEEAELQIIESYLPKQLSTEEVKAEILKVVESLSDADKKNFGKVMSTAMSSLKGRADGSVVSQIVKELLGQA